MAPAQCRAARGLLDWTQVKLAEAAGLSLSTVVKFERSGRAVAVGAVPIMKRALESAGVEFFNGDEPGVQLRKGGPRGDPAAAIPVEDLTSENDS
jgi:transcriptional regulator with XRE-family HTH domain